MHIVISTNIFKDYTTIITCSTVSLCQFNLYNYIFFLTKYSVTISIPTLS